MYGRREEKKIWRGVLVNRRRISRHTIYGRRQAVIFMSPYIDKAYVPQIMKIFGITEPVRVHYDGSRHYQ